MVLKVVSNRISLEEYYNTDARSNRKVLFQSLENPH